MALQMIILIVSCPKVNYSIFVKNCNLVLDLNTVSSVFKNNVNSLGKCLKII